jgi:tRNA A37 threonylcarbamoyladenosine synthetase subunit TsaC/SUA5/YrdC
LVQVSNIQDLQRFSAPIPRAWRKSLSGVLDGPATPIFWNIDKSEWERAVTPDKL